LTHPYKYRPKRPKKQQAHEARINDLVPIFFGSPAEPAKAALFTFVRQLKAMGLNDAKITNVLLVGTRIALKRCVSGVSVKFFYEDGSGPPDNE
jgi:hypothetical protein